MWQSMMMVWVNVAILETYNQKPLNLSQIGEAQTKNDAFHFIRNRGIDCVLYTRKWNMFVQGKPLCVFILLKMSPPNVEYSNILSLLSPVTFQIIICQTGGMLNRKFSHHKTLLRLC